MEQKTEDPFALGRKHVGDMTLRRVPEMVLRLNEATGIRDSEINKLAVKKAGDMLETNPLLAPKTLAKAAFSLAIEYLDPGKETYDVRKAITAALDEPTSYWFVLKGTMRRQLANASC